jgi:hypothetical protein
MTQVVRYFHIHQGSKGGMCVRVVGDTDIIGQVDVQVARCSEADNYCRQTGRIQATKAPVKVVPLRYLPKELEAAAKKIKIDGFYFSFDYSMKYFLPKE